MLKVPSQLFMIRISLAPSPRRVYLGDSELIERKFRVDTCTWIAVPVPDSSKVSTGFESFHIEAELSEFMNGVYATKPYRKISDCGSIRLLM